MSTQDRLKTLTRWASRHLPGSAEWTLRLVEEDGQSIAYRQDILQPVFNRHSRGVMLTVIDGDGMGYAATGELTASGMRAAAERALNWARASTGRLLFDPRAMFIPEQHGNYERIPEQTWEATPLQTRLELGRQACAALKIHDEIVDWSAWIGQRRVRGALASSRGGEILQTLHYLTPGLSATANRGSLTQQRSGGGVNAERQGGLEQLAPLGFSTDGERIAAEALQLLDAPECPQDARDLLLMPSQMVLQIHESIGHPLELDRILGDERNYAGTSFVTPEMFGSYRYGSERLNVTFDPGIPEQLASYAYDDEGTPASRQYLIRDGILERPLGGQLSQRRSGLSGVANARACHWNRPAIDRMANLNLEPGDADLEQMIASVERGVLMDGNRSWSIDDSRNKFQFGCEYGRLIEDGELQGLVRNPNYRGISAGFWRSLDRVGKAELFELGGVTNCGKGEPNQSVYVGHASPPCLFRRVEVFGGAA
jgi:predicted Zn-dependent protease